MRLPDGTILMHAGAPYDPVKAHEYYVRTRKLKGRMGSAPRASTGSARTGPGTGSTKARQPAKDNKKLAKQRSDAAVRVAVLKKKLSQLNHALKERMAEAEKADREAKKPKSASEKADAARESKKYRDKNKQQLKTKAKQANDKKPDAKKSGGGDSVTELKTTIQRVQRSLAAAVAKQRALG